MAVYKSVKLIILCLILLSANAFEIKTPESVINDSNAAILSLYASQTESPDQEIAKKAVAIMDAVTSFKTLAANVMTVFPDNVTAKQKEQFTEFFSRLLKLSAIKKLGRYRADRFEYLGVEMEEDKAIVHTVAHYGADILPIDYTLILIEERYQIVNYQVDEVDTVHNYRKQFKRILARESFDAMITRLQNKIKQLESDT